MDCPTIQELDFGEWGQEVLSRLQGRRYPLSGTFELTARCNLACVHCYINQAAVSRAALASELTTLQVKAILDQITAAGCLFLTLTGGEVLLRPDFPEIYRHARQRGMLVSLFTNGTLITPRIADLLAEVQPRVVDITLYGATQATYERVTGVPGSYARVHRGIELLRERGVPLALKTVVLTVNRHEFPAMRAFAEGLGVRFRYDGLLWPRLDRSQAPLEYQLPLQELVAVEFGDSSMQQEWARLADRFSGQRLRSENIYTCGIGQRSFHIDSAGQLSGCMGARRPAYDLLQMSFQAGWEKLGSLRQQERQLETACRTCTLNDLCSQCPGWSQAVDGSDETPVEFLCELAHLHATEVQKFRASKIILNEESINL